MAVKKSSAKRDTFFNDESIAKRRRRRIEN
jgi:hypothetical protein